MSDRSLSEVVTERIRGRILDGTLKPGERLVEDRLSVELGVSRVPVREALRGLSAEGLVTLLPRRGATVVEVTPQSVAELVEVRALLEGLNARLAAQRHDPEIVAKLEETLARGNEAAKAGTAEELARLNAEFHEQLAEASRNSVLCEVMRSLRERTSIALERACRRPLRRDRRRRRARRSARHPPRPERRDGIRQGSERWGRVTPVTHHRHMDRAHPARS